MIAKKFVILTRNIKVSDRRKSFRAPEYIELDFCLENFGCGCNLRWGGVVADKNI
jgi:hypothetical protein